MIQDRIREDMKTAMREHDSAALSTIRLLLAAIKQREVDERIQADDAVVLDVIAKMLKQRRDSVDQYRQGNREDLAQKEEAEINVLSRYMPEPMSEQELVQMIDTIVQEMGVSGMAAMGRVMAEVKTKAAGRADMGKVSALVKARLMA